VKDSTKAFLRNPPAGSKTRAAVDFGIDLTLTTRNMFGLTAAQRLERLQARQIGKYPTERRP
jgi:hypothetical protein